MPTIFNDAGIKKMLYNMRKQLEDPKPVLSEIGNTVIKKGYEKQFKTKGRHWNGEEWEERGYLTQLFRRYQDGESKAGNTLIHSGFTAGRLVIEVRGNSVIAYSPLPHVKELEQGKSGPFKVTFKKKGRLKKDHTVTMKGMPARKIFPDKLRSDELSKIKDIVEKALRKAVA